MGTDKREASPDAIKKVLGKVTRSLTALAKASTDQGQAFSARERAVAALRDLDTRLEGWVRDLDPSNRQARPSGAHRFCELLGDWAEYSLMGAHQASSCALASLPSFHVGASASCSRRDSSCLRVAADWGFSALRARYWFLRFAIRAESTVSTPKNGSMS